MVGWWGVRVVGSEDGGVVGSEAGGECGWWGV